MTLQKVNNHTTEDLVDSEGNETSVSKFKRMMSLSSNSSTTKNKQRRMTIRIFKEFKENIQKQVNELKENTD
jgi:hypothetical protein